MIRVWNKIELRKRIRGYRYVKKSLKRSTECTMFFFNNLIYVGHTRSNDMIMNDAMQNIWNEVVVACLSYHSKIHPEGLNKNMGNLQSALSV
jgi:hypothetical protein